MRSIEITTMSTMTVLQRVKLKIMVFFVSAQKKRNHISIFFFLKFNWVIYIFSCHHILFDRWQKKLRCSLMAILKFFFCLISIFKTSIIKMHKISEWFSDQKSRYDMNILEGGEMLIQANVRCSWNI